MTLWTRSASAGDDAPPAGGGAVDVVGLAPRTRRRILGDATHSLWHGPQIRRLAGGRSPDPSIGTVRVLRDVAATTLRWRLGRER
jgi:hypothetical protein